AFAGRHATARHLTPRRQRPHISSEVGPSPYEWSREIYSGARFSVLRARRVGGAGVVIKRARPGRPELRSAERLRHEYEILRFLDAPGTARALDFTTFEGDPALVLEDAGAR